ncbi:MAG: hypothetical protein KAU49_05265 [Candidatus Krumholzibacteria bacterium]|nr:hypothetical protein [Candidatus Krumholzibacteria bacterium]
MDHRDFDIITRIHSGLPELEPAADLTDRIMAGIEMAKTGRSGWIWRVLVPAAAALFVLFGIRIGTQIMDAWFEEPAVVQHAELTGLEHFEDYPPYSVGEVIEIAAKGGGNE